ncbi:hypothetical protein HPB50_015752 [Hyalomma asiaticum]|uniref:Uncharacterized protein n=1 Tax=Hyalomma asiaticum TaxID=266040 RepID=A0ACB7SID4_HYAAI|nr:hypothetical protein HPB50_015752 [Hyalomma asiaticum]
MIVKNTADKLELSVQHLSDQYDAVLVEMQKQSAEIAVLKKQAHPAQSSDTSKNVHDLQKQTIGHEITHAFEVNGFLFDDEGREAFWGTNMTEELLLEKALCLRRYHNEIDPPRRQAGVDDELDSENMADFAGMLVTLNAFNALPLPERSMLLPESAGVALTPEQAFFVSYCASNCDSGVKVVRRYAIGKGRCMVPVMNDPRFAKAFGCSDRARMNPKMKCSYW